MASVQAELRAIAARALEMIADGNVVGLGTGHAATAFLSALGERTRAGMRVRGIPTSRESASLAAQLGIPLTSFDDVETIDVTVDGADEVDPLSNLIKGYGGALVRERIVAAASRRLVILVGEEKLVPVLGARGTLPVEVVPFALPLCSRRLEKLGFPPQPRTHNGQPYVTDNGNYLLDCHVPPLDNPAEVERAIHSIPGVVGTGLFLALGPTVLIQRGETVEVREPKAN